MSTLTRHTGTSPRGLFRSLALALAVTFGVTSGLLFQTQREAFAYVGVLSPVVAALPTSLATASATTIGTGAVTYFGATSGVVGSGAAVGTATVGAVALAPVAVAAAAALVAGGALYLGWKWASGTSAGTSLDPASAGAFQGGWTVSSVYSAGFTTMTYTAGTVVQTGTSSSRLLLYATGPNGGAIQATFSNVGTGQSGTITSNGDGAPHTGSCLVATVGQLTYLVATHGAANLTACYGAVTGPKTAPTPAAGAAPGTTTVTTTPTSKCSGGGTFVSPSIVYTGATSPLTLPPIVAPACPAGQTRTEFTTPTQYPDGSPAPNPVPKWTAPIVPSAYPECQAPKVCVLTLTETAPDGRTKNCTNTTACPKYAGAPGPGPTGETWACKWGPYTMPASDCTTVPTAPPADAPVDVPTEACPAGSTNLGCAPATGANPTPDDNCNGSWSWNPVDWVLEPVLCALEKAFVPTAATTATFTSLQADAASRVPMVWLSEGAGWVTTVLAADGAASGGCLVLDVDMQVLGDVHIMDSCANEPIPNALRSMRGLVTVAVYVAFLGPLMWWAWKSYAPLSRPQG